MDGVNESGALEVQKILDSIRERINKLLADIEKGEIEKEKRGRLDGGLKSRWIVMLKAEVDHLEELSSKLEQVRVSEFGY
jgi:hypothetical protein